MELALDSPWARITPIRRGAGWLWPALAASAVMMRHWSGYIYLKLGNRRAGIADLSKAGEMGIVPAYNLIKRMSN